MHVCLYVCMCVCVYVCMCVCMHASARTYGPWVFYVQAFIQVSIKAAEQLPPVPASALVDLD